MRFVELSLLRGCPVRCSYCPQDKLRAATPRSVAGAMSYSLALRVMNNARADKIIFAGYVEPTAHPQWVELVDAALERAPRVKFHTTLHRVTPSQVEGLGSCRRVEKQVHVTRQNLTKVLELAPLILRHWPRAEWVAFDAELERDERLAELFRGPLRKLWAHSRASNVDAIDPTLDGPVGVAVTCEKVEEAPMPVVLPDGSAYLCCQDYRLEMPIGNLAEQDWSELDFESYRLRMRDPSNGLPCHRGCSEAKNLRDRG